MRQSKPSLRRRLASFSLFSRFLFILVMYFLGYISGYFWEETADFLILTGQFMKRVNSKALEASEVQRLNLNEDQSSKNQRRKQFWAKENLDHESSKMALDWKSVQRLDERNSSNTVAFGATGCFQRLGGKCKAIACDDSQERGLHLRGLVKERVFSSDPNTSHVQCKGCNVYGRQCAVSKLHRFIYIHVPKSAGSSVQQFLRSALCTPTDKAGSENCSKEVLTFDYCLNALKEHATFFKWTVIRHPFPRAVSAWGMAKKRLEKGAPALPFNEWALDPSKLKTQVWRMHWWPQAWFVTDAEQCPLYDFAATLGNSFKKDIETIVNRINSSALTDYYRLHGFPHEYHNQDPGKKVGYQNISTSAKVALLRRYREDFKAFGFSDSDWSKEFF